jgi:hypothetical protein
MRPVHYEKCAPFLQAQLGAVGASVDDPGAATVLDHVLVIDERHLERVVRANANFVNGSRPHQGIEQRIPGGTVTPIKR